MIKKKFSTSSKIWMERNRKDLYVINSRRFKFRSRSWFKLDEIQKMDNILCCGMTVVDLGSSPGGWSQYSSNKVSNKGRVIAFDILPMHPIKNVYFINGDFFDRSCVKKLLEKIGNNKVQAVISDMLPNISGVNEIDIPKIMLMSNLVLDFCCSILIRNGNLILKTFQNKECKNFLEKVKSKFSFVKIRKPNASRKESKEIYVVAKKKYN
ncbi:hypothetical protein AOQ88_00940 [Candidatus Riesia sp. GBBU]|nr:hypothetical protein AOQ88_00940 [Candidatus Riesia sp. GBBU]